MKRQSSDSSDQLKNATPRRSWDHISPNGSENTSNNNQPPHTSASDPSVSEHPPVPSITTQPFPNYTYGTSEYYNNRMDPNQMMMQNQMLLFNPMQNYQWSDNCMYPMAPVDSSCDRGMESTSNGNNSSNFESQLQTQQTESVKTEGAARSPSPLAVQYSDEEATSLMAKLRSDDTYRSALQVLASWLKNVEFTKSNSTYLFSLINCVQNSVWRVMNEKAKYKEELNNVNLDVSRKKYNISLQFREILKVLEKVKLLKFWDQCTELQRKIINTWVEKIKQMSDLKKGSATENLDPQEDSSEKLKNSNLRIEALNEEYRKYKEELDSLNSQLKAIEDYNAALRNEEKIKIKFYEDILLDMNQKYEKMQAEIEEIKSLLEVESLNKNNENEIKSISSKDSQHRQVLKSLEEERLETKHKICAEEVYHVTLISSFLDIHPFGANVDYISSCLEEFNPKLKDCLYIKNLMCRFPNLFRVDSRGEGANLTEIWVCCMFGKYSP